MVGIHRSGVAAGRPTFVTSEQLVPHSTAVLDAASARHMRVLRLDTGAPIGLRDGLGGVGEGILVRVTKAMAQVDVQTVVEVPALPAVHMLIPVADKDRMLWLAEKAGELACSSWRPVLWRRSRSVSPRGEGISFQAKIKLRMENAMAQSEGAWLPTLFPEANLEWAILAAPPGLRIVLDPSGPPMIGPHSVQLYAPVTIAVGPEGGIEDDELLALEKAGFKRASLGSTILRFETAAVAALAIARTTIGHSVPNLPVNQDLPT